MAQYKKKKNFVFESTPLLEIESHPLGLDNLMKILRPGALFWKNNVSAIMPFVFS